MAWRNIMIPLKHGLFNYKEQIKQMGGEWNGHIWCIPPNADYKLFANFLPREILDRINLNKIDDSDSIDEELPTIVFTWNIFKSIASASLKLIKENLDGNHMLADETYKDVTEFLLDINWEELEKAIVSVEVRKFKPISVVDKKEKCPRGILLWREHIGDVGWNDVFDNSSLYATGNAYEVYLSDELRLICFEIDGKEFYEERKLSNTSRRIVYDRDKTEDILVDFISELLESGQDFTQEILEKIK